MSEKQGDNNDSAAQNPTPSICVPAKAEGSKEEGHTAEKPASNEGQNISNNFSGRVKTHFKDWKVADTIQAALAVFTGMLFFLNYCGLSAANKSAAAAESTFKETQREFNINNTAFLKIKSTWIYGHGWVGKSDSAQLEYEIENSTQHPIQIDSVEQKWSSDSSEYSKYYFEWNSNKSKDTISFKNVANLELLGQSEMEKRWVIKDWSIGFKVYNSNYRKDSANIAQDKSLLFAKIYYTNKFKYLIIGKVNGILEKRVPIDREFYDRIYPINAEEK